MSIIKFNNGDEADVKVLPFKTALKLKNIIGRDVSKQGVSLDFQEDVSKVLFNVIVAIDSSEELHDFIIKECFPRCLYNGKKITDIMLEEESFRENYYELILEILKVNLLPFFKNLVSRLKELGASEEIQKFLK